MKAQPKASHYINGSFVDDERGKPVPVIYPATGETIATELESLLRVRGIERVRICGLATDYCVNATVLDARRLGFETVVVVDACAPVNLRPDDGQQALAAMSAAGAELATSPEAEA
jgi:nicotinamidase-related amidase